MGNNKESRRSFLKKSAGAGLMFTAFGKEINFPNILRQNPVRRPFIVTSHSNFPGQNGLEAAWKILKSGGSALDAVEIATNIIEVDPNDSSVGYGGMPNERGVVQLDASIMDGKTYKAGAVGCLESFINPSSVARKVMERTNHVMLVDKGAKEFALMHGFKEENLLTEKSRLMWLKWKENLSDTDDYYPPEDGIYKEPKSKRVTGTVNVLAVDANGDVAGITSTSGLAWKIPGRVGDSPIIGAGLYVHNDVGAAGVTGLGEECIKTCLSFLTVEYMRMGKSPQDACNLAQARIIENYGNDEKKINFNEKIVAINKNGDMGCSFLAGNRNSKPRMLYYDKDVSSKRTRSGKEKNPKEFTNLYYGKTVIEM